MIYTHVLQSAAAGTASPLDGLMLATDRGGIDDDVIDERAVNADRGRGGDSGDTGDKRYRGVGDDDRRRRDGRSDGDDDGPGFTGSGWPPRARESTFPCYLLTPSFTAAATSAS